MKVITCFFSWLVFCHGWASGQYLSGGRGDGYTHGRAYVYVDNSPAGFLFAGNKGDGHAQARTYVFVDNTSAGLYNMGGQADGYAQGRNYSYLNNSPGGVMFGGGSADGHSESIFSGNIPFPVTLLSFDAQAINDHVALKWATSEESNNYGFTIERSQDALMFYPLTFIVADTGRSDVHLYKAIDPAPFPGRSYYRLRQEDIDGSFSHSSIVEVFISPSSNFGFYVFPNPVSGQSFTLVFTGAENGDVLHIEILDLRGSLLQREVIRGFSLQQPSVKLHLDGKIGEGRYFVRAWTERKGMAIGRIIWVE